MSNETWRRGEHRVGPLKELGQPAAALIDPHVAQGVRIEQRLHPGHVAAVLDRRRHPPVEREHTLEIRALLLGVLPGVVVDAAASVATMSAVLSAHALPFPKTRVAHRNAPRGMRNRKAREMPTKQTTVSPSGIS
jgi:hypothetical protein